MEKLFDTLTFIFLLIVMILASSCVTEPYEKKILLAVDGSDWSMEAVRHVAKVAARERGYVVLFHVKTQADLSHKDMGTHALFREQSADIAA